MVQYLENAHRVDETRASTAYTAPKWRCTSGNAAPRRIRQWQPRSSGSNVGAPGSLAGSRGGCKVDSDSSNNCWGRARTGLKCGRRKAPVNSGSSRSSSGHRRELIECLVPSFRNPLL
ncbi:hypothetical protein VTN00DRAFT_6465 [Thermoascus crustaceus]|uniref:uncharacterized protein n=1 Tax=Thermoascus crustaceus TaxID=5088 RepID=UPI003742ADBB